MNETNQEEKMVDAVRYTINVSPNIHLGRLDEYPLREIFIGGTHNIYVNNGLGGEELYCFRDDSSRSLKGKDQEQIKIPLTEIHILEQYLFYQAQAKIVSKNLLL